MTREPSDRIPSASDLCVVIPTRDRWEVLARTLDGLACQTSRGFEVVVVVDGEDQVLPGWSAHEGVRFLTKAHGGPGSARNLGAHATNRRIILFLGDDMIPCPELVDLHLEGHQNHPDDEVAVLGHVDWHPEVSKDRIARWMDRTRTQFAYDTIRDSEAGFGHFYSCNISLKRDFFLDGDGFDEAFTYYYEDLDCGWRLGQKGMRLIYEPRARTAHLHRYHLVNLERRFRGVAEGEHLMTAKHPWFEPVFLARARAAIAAPAPSSLWPRVVDLIPARTGGLKRKAESRSNLWYDRRLSSPFLAGWAAADDLAELQEYMGDGYDHAHLVGHERAVDDERDGAEDEITFYRTSEEYLYDLTVFAMSGTKAPYLDELRAVASPGGHMLDYGCGIGADGLRLMADGYDVSFADFANPSTAFLKWRLQRRGARASVYDLDSDEIPSGFDVAYSFDVIEHVDDPFDFLDRLEKRASVVAVNFLEEDADDTDLHRPLPIAELLDHASKQGLIRYRRYHGRSHFVIYCSPGGRSVSRGRSALQRRLGRHLKGRSSWYPVPQGAN